MQDCELNRSNSGSSHIGFAGRLPQKPGEHSPSGLKPPPPKPLEGLGEHSESESHSVMPDSCNSTDHTVHGILQARMPEWVPISFSRGSSQPRDQTQVPCIAGRPAEPQRKPKNTGVGSLSLLQRIFPTQESNQGLLHCRWILYQLS